MPFINHVALFISVLTYGSRSMPLTLLVSSFLCSPDLFSTNDDKSDWWRSFSGFRAITGERVGMEYHL